MICPRGAGRARVTNIETIMSISDNRAVVMCLVTFNDTGEMFHNVRLFVRGRPTTLGSCSPGRMRRSRYLRCLGNDGSRRHSLAPYRRRSALARIFEHSHCVVFQLGEVAVHDHAPALSLTPAQARAPRGGVGMSVELIVKG